MNEQAPGAPPADAEPSRQPRASRQPLYLRLFFERHMTDLVRLIGHDGLPPDEAREKLKPLIAQYGEPTMRAAADEIVIVETVTGCTLARLTDQAKHLAIAILGRPTEKPVAASVEPLAAPTKSRRRKSSGS